MVKGANNYSYFNGESSPVTTRYHLDLTQNTTISFAKITIPSYSVQLISNGESWYKWDIELTKVDGTTVRANQYTTYSEVVTLQIIGNAYGADGGSYWWYEVYGANNQTYIDGSESPSTNNFTLNLT